MAYDPRQASIFGKGLIDASFFDPVTFDLRYFSNKLQSGNFATAMNAGIVQGGVGNAPLIYIPDGQSITIEMTAADVSLTALGLNVGERPRYGGVIEVPTPLEFVNGQLRIIGTPVPELGNNTGIPYARVEGKAYRIETEGPNAGVLVDFIGEEGKMYCVHYSVMDYTVQQFDISTLFAPSIMICRIRQPLFSAEGGDLDTGSNVGEDIFLVPRMQLSGNATRAMDQATAATTALTGNALAYDEGIAAGSVCETSLTKLAYVVRRLFGKDIYATVRRLVVIGGSMTLESGTSRQIPFKLHHDNDQTTQPIFSDFDYVSENPAVAAVNDVGLVTGGIPGTTAIQITHKTISRLEASCRVVVV